MKVAVMWSAFPLILIRYGLLREGETGEGGSRRMSRKFSKRWAGMAGMAWDHGLHATSSIERATVELREICLRVCVSQGPALGADNRLITKSPHEMRKTPPLNETYAPSPLPSAFHPLALLSPTHSAFPSCLPPATPLNKRAANAKAMWRRRRARSNL